MVGSSYEHLSQKIIQMARNHTFLPPPLHTRYAQEGYTTLIGITEEHEFPPKKLEIGGGNTFSTNKDPELLELALSFFDVFVSFF
jgi:hypothetical protein